MGFFEELRQQRWDDHRYYHHNRVNQALHFFSAMSFYSVITTCLKTQLLRLWSVG